MPPPMAAPKIHRPTVIPRTSGDALGRTPATGGLWAVLPVKAWSEAKRRLSPVLNAAEREELARSMLDDVLAAIAGSRGIAGTLAVTADEAAASHLAKAGCEVLSESRRGLNRALGTAAQELRRRGGATMLVLPIDLPLVTPTDLEELCARHAELEGRREDEPPSHQVASHQAAPEVDERPLPVERTAHAQAAGRPGLDSGGRDGSLEHQPQGRDDLAAASPLGPAEDAASRGIAVTVVPDRFRSGTNALVCSPPGCIPFRFGDGSFHAHLREAKRAGAARSGVVLPNLGLDVDHPDDLREFLRLDRTSRTGRYLRSLGMTGAGGTNLLSRPDGEAVGPAREREPRQRG